MKKLFLLLSTFFLLASCTRDYVQLSEEKVGSKPETIRSFFIANDKLYAIGEQNSYEFKDRDTRTLIATLQGPRMKLFKSAEILSLHQNIENNKVYSEIILDFNKPEPTPFSSKSSFYLEGQTIKLQNQNEILAKKSLTKPLTTELVEYRITRTTKRKFSKQDTKEGATIGALLTGAAVGAVLFIPVAIIAAPFGLLTGNEN